LWKQSDGQSTQAVQSVWLGFSQQFLKQIDGIDWPTAHIAVAAMKALGIVVDQSGVQVAL
jgi:hypothetical protein